MAAVKMRELRTRAVLTEHFHHLTGTPLQVRENE